MIKIRNSSSCCGCTACASICTHHAITMKPDVLGFLYPEFDLKKCVNCGLCEKVCAFNDDYDTSLNFQEPIAYGARHKDMSEVMLSRSGAVFVAISDYILEQKGIVYGVGYVDHFRVAHKRATTKLERDEFRGSKYVQSDLRGIFPMIKQDLKDGKTVLFVGTGCQVSGLKSYIGNKLGNNLLLVDIVCHGVPSPYLWRDYIAYLEHKFGSVISQVNFRDKVLFGWNAHNETYKFENCITKVTVDTNFYRRIFFRKSCGNCHFCNIKRPSDITIADFWGWEKQNTMINKDNKGLNLVLVNTLKGNWLFEQIKDQLIFFSSEKKIYMQPNLCHSTIAHPFRNILEQDYSKKGFEYVFFHDYDHPSIMERIRRKLYNKNK